MEERIALMNQETELLQQDEGIGKRTYTVEEIQNILGISQPTAYGLVRKNFFRTVKVGRHIRISKKSFDEWLDQKTGGAADE